MMYQPPRPRIEEERQWGMNGIEMTTANCLKWGAQLPIENFLLVNRGKWRMFQIKKAMQAAEARRARESE